MDRVLPPHPVSITTDPKITAWYREAMEGGGHYQGMTTVAYAQTIEQLLDRFGIRGLLDYGCGRGLQYEVNRLQDRWRLDHLALYDPAWPPIAAKPAGTFAGVICVDVLEHLPEHLVEPVLDDLFGYAERLLFVTVCCRPASKKLPDGRNAHLTVKPADWWCSRLNRRTRKTLHIEALFTP